MYSPSSVAAFAITVLVLLCSASADAAHHKSGHKSDKASLWALDNASSALSFVSVKAGDVGEAHKFGGLSGGITVARNADGLAIGDVHIKIELATVNTNIAIRDERMREHLFETTKYPVASVHGHIPVKEYLALSAGASTKSTLKLMLDLHGAKVPIAAEVLVSRIGENRLIVASTKPVVVNAGGFDLVAGIEKLRELAGLPGISSAVPASFVLTLIRAEAE